MKTLLAAVLLGLVAPVAAACPNAGLARRDVTFQTESGRHRFAVEVAATPEQQECGMMYRERIAPRSGMIFPFDPPKDAAFWMKNTPSALDIIFIGPDNRVVSIGNGVPFSRELVPSGGLTAHVVELARGEAARIGLKPGDRVEGLGARRR